MRTLKSFIFFFSISLFFLILSACGGDDNEQIEISFSATSTSIGNGETVQFSSSSTGNITAYNWFFEGGSPATSSEPNPEVAYNTSGTFDVELTVTVNSTQKTESINDYIDVTCNRCSQECPDLCTQQLIEDKTIQVDGLQRTYDIFLPSVHDISEDLPVIINLHGTTGNKTLERTLTEFVPIAEENKIVMVYPQGNVLTTCNIGPQNRWNANLFNSPNDVNFISDLIDKLIEDYNVDGKRIYVVGRSNGGFMAYTLACQLSEKITAVASVAGAMKNDTMDNFCNATRVVPILEIHGTADQVNSYNGYRNCEGDHAKIDDIMSFWRNKAGCSAEFEEHQYPNIDTTDNSTAKRLTYKDCNNYVQLIIIENGGHTYPGSRSFESHFQQHSNLLWPMNFDIEASKEVWNFFKDFSL